MGVFLWARYPCRDIREKHAAVQGYLVHKEPPSPQDYQRTNGIGLLQGPKGRHFPRSNEVGGSTLSGFLPRLKRVKEKEERNGGRKNERREQREL